MNINLILKYNTECLTKIIFSENVNFYENEQCSLYVKMKGGYFWNNSRKFWRLISHELVVKKCPTFFQ